MSFETFAPSNRDQKASSSEKLQRPNPENIEDLYQKIMDALHNFTGPDQWIIDWAKEIIRAMGDAGGEKKAGNDERAEMFPKPLKKKLLKKYKGCVGCGATAEGNSRHASILELHHIIPREQGGSSEASNALLVCRDCHLSVHQ